ncbi:hypothetical protein EV202_14910, partial [Bacteroides heparinolyticus]
MNQTIDISKLSAAERAELARQLGEAEVREQR